MFGQVHTSNFTTVNKGLTVDLWKQSRKSEQTFKTKCISFLMTALYTVYIAKFQILINKLS